MSTSQTQSLTDKIDLNWEPLNEPGSGGLIASVSFNPDNPDHILMGGDMLGVGLSLDGGQSWQRPEGFTTSFEIEEFTWNPDNPNIVWAATREGPYLSRDGGRSWEPKRQGMPAEFTNGDRFTSPIQKIIYGSNGSLLAFGGNHREFLKANQKNNTENFGTVWESRDNGESWSIRGYVNPGNTGSGYNIKSVTYAADNQTLYAAVEAHGVYRSNDQGKTWKPANGGKFSNANDIAAHPNQPGTLWVSTETGLYKTKDGGATWFAANDGIKSNHIKGSWEVIEVAPSDPNVLMAANYQRSALYRSTDGGESWQPLRNQPETAFDNGTTPRSLSFHPNDADRVILGTFSTAFISEDQGDSWFDATSQQADAAANEWKGRGFAGWVSRNIEWNPYQTNQVVFQGMDQATLWLSEDLEGWRAVREQPNGASNPIEQFGGGWDTTFAADGKTIYTTLNQQFSKGNSKRRGIARSQDGGKTWAYLKNQPGNVAKKTAHAYEIHTLPGNSNHLWVRVDDQLWQSKNGGDSWGRISLNGAKVVDLAAPTDIVSNPADAIIYAATESGVYRFKNNNWSNLGGVGNGERVDLEVDPHDSSRVYLANWNSYGDGGLYRWENDNWSQLSDNRYISDVAVSPKDPNLLIATTNQNPYKMSNSAPGVMISRDRGQTWQLDNDGLGVIRAQTVEFSPDGSQVVVGTTGGGFFISTLDGSASPTTPSLPTTVPGFNSGDFAPLQPEVTPNPSEDAGPSTPIGEQPSPLPEATPTEPIVSSPTSPNNSMPLRVEVEDYQDFSDRDRQNRGGAYRQDAVDIQASGDREGGYSVGWIREGEWLTYQLDVAEAGNYQLVARAASLVDQAHRFQASVDGQSTQVDLTGTGGWKNWQDFTSTGTLALEAGQNELRLDMESDRFNLNYLDLVKASEPSPSGQPVPEPVTPSANPTDSGIPVPEPSPLRIEAEDYQDFRDTTTANLGRAYRNDGVDIQNSEDTGGGYSVGWIRQGEWLTYEFDVPTAGEYEFVARGASLANQNHRVRASIGEQNTEVTLNGTGGWQNWQDFTASETLSLQAGRNQLRVDMLSSRFNLNYFDLVPTEQSDGLVGDVKGVFASANLSSGEAANLVDLEELAVHQFSRSSDGEDDLSMDDDLILGDGGTGVFNHPQSNHAAMADQLAGALSSMGEASSALPEESNSLIENGADESRLNQASSLVLEQQLGSVQLPVNSPAQGIFGGLEISGMQALNHSQNLEYQLLSTAA